MNSQRISFFLSNYSTYTFLVLFFVSFSPQFDILMLMKALGLGFIIERTVEFDSHLDKVKKTSWLHRIISLVSLVTIVVILIPHLGSLFLFYAFVFIWYDVFWSKFWLSKYAIATSYAILSIVYYPNQIFGFSATLVAIVVFALCDLGYQISDDIRDLKEDQNKDRRTLPILYGVGKTRIFITVLFLASAILFLWAPGTHRWIWIIHIVGRLHMVWKDDYRLVVVSFLGILAHSVFLALA